MSTLSDLAVLKEQMKQELNSGSDATKVSAIGEVLNIKKWLMRKAEDWEDISLVKEVLGCLNTISNRLVDVHLREEEIELRMQIIKLLHQSERDGAEGAAEACKRWLMKLDEEIKESP